MSNRQHSKSGYLEGYSTIDVGFASNEDVPARSRFVQLQVMSTERKKSDTMSLKEQSGIKEE